uniref:Uncharacterized protein n=1 Tax=Coccidioides posadasii RMSCC 3488 TaxID=454284 RepID=A0A0J6F776_COCPO|nr:hypothetical protein CPAG_05155 [Coccidioides posadasii RMSCC 3488]
MDFVPPVRGASKHPHVRDNIDFATLSVITPSIIPGAIPKFSKEIRRPSLKAFPSSRYMRHQLGSLESFSLCKFSRSKPSSPEERALGLRLRDPLKLFARRMPIKAAVLHSISGSDMFKERALVPATPTLDKGLGTSQPFCA